MSSRFHSLLLIRLAIAVSVSSLAFGSELNGAEQGNADLPESDSPQAGAIVELLERDLESAIARANALQSTENDSERTSRLIVELESAWLADRSVQWTRNCVTLLEGLVPNPDAGRLLVRFLEDQRPEVRQLVLEAAVRSNVVNEPRILPLIASLHHGEASQRYESARLLGKFGSRAAPAAESLVRAATDTTSHVSVRWEAVFALREMGRIGGGALGEVVAESEKSVAYKALDSLATLGDDAEPAYASVVNALGNNDSRIRVRAVAVLGTLNSKADESLPKLRVLLNDPDRHLRNAAQSSIRKLESSSEGFDPKARFEAR